MLNSNLDLTGLAEEFSDQGRVCIRNAFIPEAAESIHSSLRDEVLWRLSLYDNRRASNDKGFKLTSRDLQHMGPEGRSAMQAEMLRQARSQFQYLYRSFDLLDGYRRGESPDIFLYRLMKYLAGDEFFAFARRLIGDPAINRIAGQASCYTAGHFLKNHADESQFEQRRAAYVVGMTRDWEADMGGMLMFMDEDGQVEETLVPGFNTLTVFRVPVRHLVSEVAPWVTQQRLSVTGWLTVGEG
jgi:Rps23 Pro-64 3,4-dihydroxylase Tpa1-like proline 4-hydroxylase